MDYELIFWIVSCVAAMVSLCRMVARANKEVYVDWMAEEEDIKW